MTTFSAGPQALGYFYQARVALSLLLESPDEARLRVEALDDIEISDAVSAGSLSLIQLKHHTGDAALTDASPDLWKSLRVWSEQAKSAKFALDNVKIVLFTTATIPAGSLASLLGHMKRDVNEAEKKLLEVASKSDNASLKKAFDAFKGLTDAQRKALLATVYIVGSHPDISGTKKKIDQQLRLAVRAEHLAPFAERVEGWWTDKVILHLLAKNPRYAGGITGFELHEYVASVAETFHDGSLPIDYDGLDMTDDEVDANRSRQYVKQLETINASARVIRKAIFDYHRAYNQRHRWLRDSLIFPEEMEKYEERLCDEWERYFDHNFSFVDETDNQALITVGKAILRWAELECNLRIRPRVEAEFVRRGSFHILADKIPPDICWHPKFADLMTQAMTAAAT
ncbi:conserved hypothetical protein [Candidatus Propionivibrio aalborgensis]|uniref:ABC-three component systems C-terminal domain-containing protein n=1 Tax=Candidatus Propionivibrio aalborgensis TaxID=1860101 RepID=A0A1A8Y497_9RHOO|nr:ABC-three component system protein [Candidatus Propionivibrio aalborgensis]SBT11208.1 conserved hypothetical protein [Candidatus Propionivibrio aalborgensis]